MQNLSAGVRFRCLAKSQPEVRILIMGEIFRFQLRFLKYAKSHRQVRILRPAKSQAKVRFRRRENSHFGGENSHT